MVSTDEKEKNYDNRIPENNNCVEHGDLFSATHGIER
jgi:hypothetical protein